jgi:putative transposase
LTVAAPKRFWAGAITPVRTAQGWRDRAVVIDLFSRQMAGFAIRERMTRPFVIDGLRMAWFLDRAYLHGPAA